MIRIPRLNDPVHYVAYGTPGGEYQSVCRAAVITQVPAEVNPGWPNEVPGAVVADLFVMNPSGTFFNRCPQNEVDRRGGTWHYGDDCPN